MDFRTRKNLFIFLSMPMRAVSDLYFFALSGLLGINYNPSKWVDDETGEEV